MYTCIIIDDQEEAVKLLSDHVNKIPLLSIKMATTNPVEALGFLDSEKVDIIFLDIQMPDLSGIELIDNLKEKWGNDMPKVVFTTGYNDYALTGYEYGVVDYLLKPISFKRFKKSVDRIISDLNKHIVQPGNKDFFFVDIDGQKVKINFEDIVYIEGARNYVIIVTLYTEMITYKTLSSVYELLPADKFIRIHKSYIVAIDKIQAIKGNKIILQIKEEVNIPIGITYRKTVLNQLKIV